MLVDKQVLIKWSPSNIKHYESILDDKGNQKYVFTNVGNVFAVDVKDLTKYSSVKVKVKCDYCGDIVLKNWGNLLVERNKNNIEKDCCKECKGKKMRESSGNEEETFYEEKEDENVQQFYTKEFLIDEFYRYYKEFGIYPRVLDINNTDGYPSATSYTKHWGNFTNLLKELDLIGENGWYKEDEKTFKELYLNGAKVFEINSKMIVKRSIYELNKKIKSMDLPFRELFESRKYNINMPIVELLTHAITDLYEDIGKIPTSMDFDYYTKLNKLPSRKRLEKLIDKKFSEWCLDLFSNANKVFKSNEELIEDLINLKDKLGRTPMTSELKAHGISDHKTYSRRFKMTYNEIIESLGWEVHSFKQKFKSEEELLSDFERLYIELGRVPNYQEINNCEYTSSFRTYTKYFGSIENILKLLDIDIPCNQDSSAGFVSKNKNGEVCKSHAEMAISNIFIDNNIKYNYELKYSDFDKELKSRWKMDWYLSDYSVYVEYFGMYSEGQLNRKGVLGKYSRKVVKKINYCNENNIKLIDIYKEDLENNYEGLIIKFKSHGICLKIIENEQESRLP